MNGERFEYYKSRHIVSDGEHVTILHQAYTSINQRSLQRSLQTLLRCFTLAAVPALIRPLPSRRIEAMMTEYGYSTIGQMAKVTDSEEHEILIFNIEPAISLSEE